MAKKCIQNFKYSLSIYMYNIGIYVLLGAVWYAPERWLGEWTRHHSSHTPCTMHTNIFPGFNGAFFFPPIPAILCWIHCSAYITCIPCVHRTMHIHNIYIICILCVMFVMPPPYNVPLLLLLLVAAVLSLCLYRTMPFSHSSHARPCRTVWYHPVFWYLTESSP